MGRALLEVCKLVEEAVISVARSLYYLIVALMPR